MVEDFVAICIQHFCVSLVLKLHSGYHWVLLVVLIIAQLSMMSRFDNMICVWLIYQTFTGLNHCIFASLLIINCHHQHSKWVGWILASHQHLHFDGTFTRECGLAGFQLVSFLFIFEEILVASFSPDWMSLSGKALKETHTTDPNLEKSPTCSFFLHSLPDFTRKEHCSLSTGYCMHV